ncbi:transposase family protein [Pseudomonas nitroreducens]|uniref:Transposase family protein n=1 Tax=Pseudomonas nitroreducens TaxID=46680 RepID=A0A5R9A1C9_PSENT|nr:transposase family protein [Pseudomonas nitroreducens]
MVNLFSHAVVGWTMHHRIQLPLVHAALEMAVARQQSKEEVPLSDRGSQYYA